jgi:hypothetical protein
LEEATSAEEGNFEEKSGNGGWLVAGEFLLPLSSVSLRAHPFINMELTDEL